MRETTNKVRIQGRIYSFGEANGRNTIEQHVTGENSKAPGTEYIQGVIQVAIDEEGINVIPVHFTYVTRTYAKSGKANPNFSVLAKLMTEAKTWIEHGKDAATKVRIDGAIALNDFYNAQNELVSAKQIDGSFISIINVLPEPHERNTFECDMIITNVSAVEPDEEKGITEGYTRLRGAVFNFRKEILPLEFIVKNPEGGAYFESLDVSGSNPVFTKVNGVINCETHTTTKVEESAFGAPTVKTFERKIREWIVSGASKTPYEFGEDGVLTTEEVTTALQNREVYLAEIKRRAEEYRTSKSAPAATTTTATTTAPKAAAFNF